MTNTILKSTYVALVAGLVAGFVMAFYLFDHATPAQGSVIAGNEYQSDHITSSDASSTAATFGKSGYGAVGSVVITDPASTGNIRLYDATSTTATSTGTLITEFNASSDVAGTYTFDVNFNDGLMIDVPAGFDGQYTVTWR